MRKLKRILSDTPRGKPRGILQRVLINSRESSLINTSRILDRGIRGVIVCRTMKEEKTIAQISSEFGIHAHQVQQWRQKLLEDLPQAFSDRSKKAQNNGEA